MEIRDQKGPEWNKATCVTRKNQNKTYHRQQSMSTPARRRLMRDFKRLQTDPPAGISGAPQENDILKWHAVIFG